MRILLTAGGTGGHIMPAMAIAEALRDLDSSCELLYVGTDRGLEEKLARDHKLNFISLSAMGIKGKSFTNLVKSIRVNGAAFIKALRVVGEFKPDWVIGTGGYVTGMVVLAGKLKGASCAIHEQNSVPGLTNRILARMADRIYLAFPDRDRKFPAAKSSLVGNPVRKSLNALDRNTAPAKLLIMGGSLGAHSINVAASQALKILSANNFTVDAIHQTGKADLAMVRDSYADIARAEARDFIDDMAAVYRDTRLMLCRAGGLSLAEASRMGIPAIMVPFPHATDDHQRKNAEFVAQAGGGWIIHDSELHPETLATRIEELFNSEHELKQRSKAIRSLKLGDGAERIAKEILGV